MEQLILPDGSAIGSGEVGRAAICGVLWRQDRNDGTQLRLGSACDSSLRVELFSPKKPEIPPGTRLIYREDGVTRGIFYCQELQRQGKHRWVLTAQDAMHRFDRELEDFWEGRADDTALSLLIALCAHCGVATAIASLPGGDIPVPPLKGYSGRQLLGLLGQVAGRFFYINKEEQLCAGWYEETVSADNYSKLTCAEYATAPIERLWLRQTKTDAGMVYPDGDEPRETYIFLGNPIFSVDFMHTAQRLLQQLEGFSHTPFALTLLPGQEISPGSLVRFTDLDGVARTGAVMHWEKHNGVCTVCGTGSHSLQSPQAFNHLTLGDLSDQLLSISRTAQGLTVSHRDLQGNVGALQLSLSGVTSRVTGVEQTADALVTQTTQLTQNGEGFSLAISQLAGSLDGKTDREEFSQVTEHFSFDAGGLTIQNSASGMGIQVSENQVAFTGGDDPTTVIRPDDMETTRLTVGKRLDLGNFSFLPRTDGNLSFRFTGQTNS